MVKRRQQQEQPCDYPNNTRQTAGWWEANGSGITIAAFCALLSGLGFVGVTLLGDHDTTAILVVEGESTKVTLKDHETRIRQQEQLLISNITEDSQVHKRVK